MPPREVEKIRFLFEHEFQKPYTLNDIAALFGISKYRICREFTDAYGISPIQYLNRKRIDAARQLLLTTEYKVHEIGSMVGIDNTAYFITLFKKHTGLTPLSYRQQEPFSLT